MCWRKNVLVTGSADGQLKGWNDVFQPKWEVNASPLSVLSLDLASDASYCVTSTMDAHLKFWRIEETATLLTDVDVPPSIFSLSHSRFF